MTLWTIPDSVLQCNKLISTIFKLLCTNVSSSKLHLNFWCFYHIDLHVCYYFDHNLRLYVLKHLKNNCICHVKTFIAFFSKSQEWDLSSYCFDPFNCWLFSLESTVISGARNIFWMCLWLGGTIVLIVQAVTIIIYLFIYLLKQNRAIHKTHTTIIN